MKDPFNTLLAKFYKLFSTLFYNLARVHPMAVKKIRIFIKSSIAVSTTRLQVPFLSVPLLKPGSSI